MNKITQSFTAVTVGGALLLSSCGSSKKVASGAPVAKNLSSNGRSNPYAVNDKNIPIAPLYRPEESDQPYTPPAVTGSVTSSYNNSSTNDDDLTLGDVVVGGTIIAGGILLLDALLGGGDEPDQSHQERRQREYEERRRREAEAGAIQATLDALMQSQP